MAAITTTQTEGGKTDAFFESLDHKSRQIIEYAAKNGGHGSIREFARLIDAPSDMDVLFRIRDVINRSSRRIFGRPFMRFEERRIDKATGKIMTFRWWLDEKIPVLMTTDAEIFDEGNSIRVVIARGPPDLKAVLDEGRTLVLSGGARQQSRRKIELPCRVRDPKTSFKNGVVEVKLDKIAWRR